MGSVLQVKMGIACAVYKSLFCDLAGVVLLGSLGTFKLAKVPLGKAWAGFRSGQGCIIGVTRSTASRISFEICWTLLLSDYMGWRGWKVDVHAVHPNPRR